MKESDQMPKPEKETLDFILANICHLHHARAHQLFEAIGLYRGQPPVLFALWEQEGLTQTELAKDLRVSPATVTKMLQRMEKAGFILRNLDTQDQRVTRVYLTEAGRSVRSQLEAVLKKMEAETFAGFSEVELDLLRKSLLHMRSNLQQATGEG
jgi:MarR family transcriptional regulator, organic hydroperoxide resistance regulator